MNEHLRLLLPQLKGKTITSTLIRDAVVNHLDRVARSPYDPVDPIELTVAVFAELEAELSQMDYSARSHRIGANQAAKVLYYHLEQRSPINLVNKVEENLLFQYPLLKSTGALKAVRESALKQVRKSLLPS